MLARIITLAIVLGGAWWYYNGPWKEQSNPGYDKRLETLQEQMALCIRGKQYRAGSTGENVGIPEDVCAEKLEVYMTDKGLWHRYDEAPR